MTPIVDFLTGLSVEDAGRILTAVALVLTLAWGLARLSRIL